MANYDIAFEWLMDSEDPERACLLLPDAPPGAHTISGVNSYHFPTAFDRIAEAESSVRMSLVKDFYLNYFWVPSKFQDLVSDELAKRVFDAAVNMGSQTAVKLLQQSFPPPFKVDGVWGPETIDAANNRAIMVTVTAFKNVRRQHYLEIVQNNPSDTKYLAGWLRRAQR